MKKTMYSVWEVEYQRGTDGELDTVLINCVEDGIEVWQEAYAKAHELSQGLGKYEAFSYEV